MWASLSALAWPWCSWRCRSRSWPGSSRPAIGSRPSRVTQGGLRRPCPGAPRAHHGDHPYGIAVRVADVADHLLEIRLRRLAADRSQFADRLDIPVAPGFEDRRHRLPRYAHRVDDDVVEPNLVQVQRRQDPEGVATDEKVGPGCRLETRGRHVP